MSLNISYYKVRNMCISFPCYSHTYRAYKAVDFKNNVDTVLYILIYIRIIMTLKVIGIMHKMPQYVM